MNKGFELVDLQKSIFSGTPNRPDSNYLAEITKRQNPARAAQLLLSGALKAGTNLAVIAISPSGSCTDEI